MLRKVFEVDALLCSRCRVEMDVVACIIDPAVIDAILRHRREAGLVSPFAARAAGGVVASPVAIVPVGRALDASSRDAPPRPLRAACGSDLVPGGERALR